MPPPMHARLQRALMRNEYVVNEQAVAAAIVARGAARFSGVFVAAQLFEHVAVGPHQQSAAPGDYLA